MSLIMVNPLVGNEQSPNFASVHVVQDPWQALIMTRKIRADVLHVITPSGGSELLLEIIRSADCPVVLDPYDCTEGMMTAQFAASARAHEVERACFEAADHICSRSLEPLFLRRHFGYQMARTTYFPEYCWRTPRRRPRREVGDDDELHIVYVGGILPENRYDPKEWGYAQYLEIGRELARQRIHLHLYPSPSVEKVNDFQSFFELYIREAEANKFFHMHRSVPTAELNQILPGYDAALHVFGVGVTTASARNSEAKIRYSTAAKLFDYIQAGLPVLIHSGFHQLGLVRHYGEPVPLECLEQTREKLSEVLRRSPPAMRRSAAIDFHAARLKTMYQTVVEGGAS